MATHTYSLDTDYTAAANVTAVLLEVEAGDAFSGRPPGRSVGTLPLSPGTVLHVRGDKAADVRLGGTTLAHRIIVAGAPGAGSLIDGITKFGGAGGGLSGGDGQGAHPGAGATQTTGYALGDGEPGTYPGGDGYFGGFAGNSADGSAAGGGSGYLSPLLYDASTTQGGGTADHAWSVVLTEIFNLTPNAPALGFPNGQTVAFDAVNRLRWTFSDDQAWDSQSAYQVRYRVVGATDWTTLAKVTSTNQYADISSGTFDANDFEYQVKTWDALGAEGPWSTSGFFTAAASPSGPTITAPTNGASIVTPLQTATWSVDVQDSWQLRRVADDGSGGAVEATVYYDTGQVDTDERSTALDFETNNRDEHVQLRVKVGGVWSAWTDALVSVSYTAPPTPSYSLTPDPDLGRLLVTISNPASDESQPATSYNRVEIDDGLGKGYEPKPYNIDGSERVPVNTVFEYWTPVDGRNYGLGAIRVYAVGDNGSTAMTDTPT